MARNRKRYCYVQVGISREPAALEHLQEEARRRGVGLSTHIADLLADRDAAIYGVGESRGMWFPRGVPVQSAQPLAKADKEPDIKANLDAFSQFMDEDDEPTLPRLPAVRR